MSNYDRGSVYSVPVLGSEAGSNRTNQTEINPTNTIIIKSLEKFLQEFRIDESFKYRDNLRANLLRKEYTLEIEMGDLIGFDPTLADQIRAEPGDYIPLVSCTRYDRRRFSLVRYADAFVDYLHLYE